MAIKTTVVTRPRSNVTTILRELGIAGFARL